MAPAKDEEFPLAALIERLGDEIREAMRRHREAHEDDLLDVTQCSVELGFTWTGTVDAGLDLKVVRLGGTRNKANTQTITVTLQPAAGPGGRHRRIPAAKSR